MYITVRIILSTNMDFSDVNNQTKVLVVINLTCHSTIGGSFEIM